MPDDRQESAYEAFDHERVLANGRCNQPETRRNRAFSVYGTARAMSEMPDATTNDKKSRTALLLSM